MLGIQCTRNSPSRKHWRHGENGTSPRHTGGGGGGKSSVLTATPPLLTP
jgi:hypothetical protein